MIYNGYLQHYFLKDANLDSFKQEQPFQRVNFPFIELYLKWKILVP